MLACLGLFLVAPFMGWWLPEAVSTHAWDVDFLFYVILYITGFFFVLTELILVCFMYRYGTQADGRPPVPKTSMVASMLRPVTGILNEPHKIEIAWTIVPAGILLYIAFAQIGTWAEVKYQSRLAGFLQGKTPIVAEVSARQFEWRVRTASRSRTETFLAGQDKEGFDAFARNPHADDVHGVNELHVIKDHPVLIHLGTRDVIHSFNLPHMRVKQDALPGKTLKVWFTPTKANTRKNDTGRWEDGYNPVTKQPDHHHVWDLACAELCGWGHYRMVGRLYVHETREDYLDWLADAELRQNERSTITAK